MLGVNVIITRFFDPHEPGVVECKLIDAHGKEWLFIEKVPVVSTELLDADSSYPQPGIIGCEIVERQVDGNGDAIVLIDTELPWHIESISNETKFTVYAHQLTTE